jgi:DNA polymerase-3 subunit gamma/tau
MSEVTLYRKYRPGKFSEVMGQDQVVQALQAAVKEEKVAHAYLFAGSRGTGKTSVARILAREIKCSANDLYEIDAASNRGIDEIRELREAVRTLPFDSAYKVYIIDEVHMLTKEAFNALLKTLEEPPDHVIFILATTELHKLPETIISRCQTFLFRKPSLEEIKTIVKKVAKSEGFSLDSEGADIIALLSEGSFRDALGVLQKVITSSADKKITVAEVEKITGSPSSSLVDDFLGGILEKDAPRGLKAIREAAARNYDLALLLKLTMRKLRLALLLRLAPEMKNDLVRDLNTDELQSLTTIATHPRAADLPAILRDCLVTYDEIARAFLPELPLELLLSRWILV